METKLFWAATADSATLWWDQPEASPAGLRYTLRLNGAQVYTGDRTHCTAEGLAPDTSYHAVLYAGEEPLDSAQVHTGARRRRLNVLDYGAVGDGAAMDTAALQRAIDACGPGDEVYLPAGVFLSGGLRLHSHMAMYLDEGAVLQGSQQPQDYLPRQWSRFEGIEQECYQSLLNLGELDHSAGPNCCDVMLYGKGTINGGGQTLGLRIIDEEQARLRAARPDLDEALKDCENEHTIAGRARGRLISLCNCEHVRITGLHLGNGASWNVHMIYSRDIVTDHCEFRSEGVWNGDGWDPDSSEDCTLFACRFFTGDDSVAVKSGKNPEGNRINRPTRRVRVFDCVSECGLGIAIGSEISGGVEDVRIWHCDLARSLSGLQIKGTRKRGGYVRNVLVRDCTLCRFIVRAVSYNDDGEGSPVPPVFAGCRCERVHLTGWAHEYWEKEDHSLPGIDLCGFDQPGYEARDMLFRDCTLGGEGIVRMQHCENIRVEVSRTE